MLGAYDRARFAKATACSFSSGTTGTHQTSPEPWIFPGCCRATCRTTLLPAEPWPSSCGAPPQAAASRCGPFTAQTLDQMRNATPLTLDSPPAEAPVFVPGCSQGAAGMPCGWAQFRQTVESKLDPSMVR